MKREDLKAKIIEQIINGALKPGARIPSERELAFEASLARGTVAKVLRELEEEGFIVTLKGKGRFVRDPKEKKKTMSIGVVFWDFTHSVHPAGLEVLRGIEEVLTKEGYRIVIYTAKKPPSIPLSGSIAFNVVPLERVDGLIAGSQELSNQEIERVSGLLPIAGFNLDSSLKIPLVIADYAWVGYKAVEYLAGQGRKKLALLNAWETFPIARNLFEGYRLGLEQMGLPFSSSLIRTGYYDFDVGYYLTTSILESERPDGIICGDDFMAAGAVKAIKDAGLSIPGDIAVIGCNDLPIARMMEPTLTTFHIDFRLMGIKTAEMLLQLISGEEPAERKIYIKPTLIVRRST